MKIDEIEKRLDAIEKILNIKTSCDFLVYAEKDLNGWMVNHQKNCVEVPLVEYFKLINKSKSMQWVKFSDRPPKEEGDYAVKHANGQLYPFTLGHIENISIPERYIAWLKIPEFDG